MAHGLGHNRVGGQPGQCHPTRLDERHEVAAVVSGGVMFVVVDVRESGSERRSECLTKGITVEDRVWIWQLHDAVEVVEGDLERRYRPDDVRTHRRRYEHSEAHGSLQDIALRVKRIECHSTQRTVRNPFGVPPPRVPLGTYAGEDAQPVASVA